MRCNRLAGCSGSYALRRDRAWGMEFEGKGHNPEPLPLVSFDFLAKRTHRCDQESRVCMT